MISSLRDTEQAPVVPPSAPSNAELERLRQHSIHVLGSVATVLEAAARQKQTLQAEVQTAAEALQRLSDTRALAETKLAATRAEVEQAANEAERATAQRLGILSEVDTVFKAGKGRRAALDAEIALLAQQRHELDRFIQARSRPIPHGVRRIAIGSIVVLLLPLVLLLTPLTQVFGGLQLLAMTSGSMEPTMPVGGVVAIQPVSTPDLRVGDAITYVDLSNRDVLITHRIVSLELRDGETILTTKGDANQAADTLPVPASRAVGRVEFVLPFLGYVMVWASSLSAKILVVILAILALGVTSLKRARAAHTHRAIL